MLFSNPKKIVESLDIREGDTIADVGSGIGRYTIPLSIKTGSSGIVYAIDVNDDVLERLKSEINDSKKDAGSIDILKTNIETNIPEIPQNSCDWVVCANVFFMLEHKSNAINTIKNILKTDGKVLLIEWKNSYSGMGPSPEHVFFENEAIKIFEENGLFVNKKVNSGSHHYGLVFSRTKKQLKIKDEDTYEEVYED